MALCKVESLGIFCRVSAYFSVSQPRVPDREILTTSEHSVRGPREAVFTVTTGSRSAAACPDAAIRALTPVSRSVEGASGDMAEPVASCADSENNGSPAEKGLISGRA